MNLLEKKCYIAGQLKGTNTWESVNSPTTDRPVGKIAYAGQAEVESALQSAQKAFSTWAKTSLKERQTWIYQLRDALQNKEAALKEALRLETGKPDEQTAYEFQILMDSLEFYAQAITRVHDEILPDHEDQFTHRVTHEPAGVVVALLAWNFPILNLAYKLAPAMAAGCPIILKPSNETPLSAYIIGEACAEIGLPAGVVNILAGPDATVGTQLCKSKIPNVITLIGSTATGRKVMEMGATSIKRYNMELGGNAPAVVFQDADIDAAIETIGALKFGNTGQICVAPNRILVHRSLLESFCEKIQAYAAAVEMGPLINHRERKRIHELVQEAIHAGATLLCGGVMPEGAGAFYPATVIKDVTPEMRLFREEIFGPVASILSFDDDDEAIALANETEAGLASYAFTQNPQRQDRVAHEFRFGEVQLNGFKYSIELPHMGIEQSGMGCDCSYLALDDYLIRKRTTIKR